MPLTLSLCPAITDVTAVEWDALVGDDDPFVEHACLAALETSGSVSGEAGWAPCHLLLREAGRLVGVAPLYLKSHSYGEYIFDWGWANAAQRARVPYYPKLVCAVPFTPATGPRLMVLPGRDPEPLRHALAEGLLAAVRATGAHSVHVLFCSEAERLALEAAGFLGRLTYQFHWTNAHPETGRPYEDFDDFVGAFRASDHHKLRRERRDAAELGLELVERSAETLTDAEWTVLDQFYRVTADEKGAIPYLTSAFFDQLRAQLPSRVHVNLALDAGRPVAGALGFRKGTQLFGRYWGAFDRFEMLHFELCYYRNIERAIADGLTRFEAGAQGEHKLKRGLLPSATWSAHWIADPALARPIAASLTREREATLAEMAHYLAHSPFRGAAAPTPT